MYLTTVVNGLLQICSNYEAKLLCLRFTRRDTPSSAPALNSSCTPLSTAKQVLWHQPSGFLLKCLSSIIDLYLLLQVVIGKDSVAHCHYRLVIVIFPSQQKSVQIQLYCLWRGDTEVQKLLLAEPRHCGSYMKHSLSYACAEIGDRSVSQKRFKNRIWQLPSMPL